MAKCRAFFFASAFVAFFCLTFAPSNIFASPSKHCLQCICEASSGCKPNIRCHNTGNGQYFCGPYQISWAYWADAGKPGSTGFSNDFENCLIDKNCAEAAVRGYMAKWGADCDGNGQVDCFDYAAIHKTGPGGCQQQWLLNSKYWSDFKQCYTGSSVNTNRQVFNAPQPPRAAISSSVPLANSQPSFSSSSSFRAIPVGGGNPSDTIIEIPKPLVSRPPGRLSSATSSSSSSTAFGSPSSGPAFASFSSSSSFSRHNSHTEVEISEESSSSNTVSSSTNRIAPPSLPGVTATTTHFAPLRPLQPSFPPLAPPPAPAPVPSITFSSSSSSLPSLPSYPPVSAPSSPPQANPSRPTTLFQTLPRPPANFNPIVPSDCLECLCQASSKCSKTGCEGAYCGPFLLSWGYWADSGSPGNGANYPSCANNRTCAELAVHGYMNKWNKDCDNDGQITCNDFALIHKLGPHACGKTEAIKDTDYWRRYETCRGEENESSSNDSPLLISSVGSNALQPDLSTANRFAPLPQPPPPPPPKPEIEVEEGPSNPPLVDQPLSRPAPLSTGNAPETIRISFNNREIVNINGNTNRLSQPPSYAVPPATVHSRPLEAEQPLPAISDADDSLAAIPETNDNLNVISNSPLARASPLPAASLYNPAANRNQPQPPPPPPQPSVPTYKPLSSTEAPFVEVRPSSPNTDYYDTRLRDSSEGRSSPLSASPSLASQPSEQPSPTSNLPTRSDSLARGRSVGGSNSSSVSNSIVPQDCLECICHASSRCNNNAGCVSDGTGKFICGPYQVDWEYWTEAGKPGQRADLSNLENFQQCLTNRQCADETVRGYMTRFLKDCDENGVRDCNDMAAIHIAGARNCHAQWYLDSQYYADFRSCYDFRRRK